MRKMLAGMFIIAAILFMAGSGFCGDVDAKTIQLSALSTNATTQVLDIAGQLGMIKITPSIVGNTNDAVTVTVTEVFTGQTIYTKAGLTNSVVLTPARVLTDSAGADVTYDGTNKVHAPFMVAGVSVSATSVSTNAPSLAVGVLYDKKR
jgi:hypothetical protein